MTGWLPTVTQNQQKLPATALRSTVGVANKLASSNTVAHAASHWQCLPNESKLSKWRAHEHHIDHISSITLTQPDPISLDPIYILLKYSLLDTIFHNILLSWTSGNRSIKSPESLLHVGRLHRPTCSGFEGLEYRYFPGGPKSKK